MILAAVVVFIIFVPNTIFDNITAPIICFTVSYIFYENVIGKVFISLGKHATNMWLIHYPIMVTFIPKIIFFPRYWLVIYFIVDNYYNASNLLYIGLDFYKV